MRSETVTHAFLLSSFLSLLSFLLSKCLQRGFSCAAWILSGPARREHPARPASASSAACEAGSGLGLRSESVPLTAECVGAGGPPCVRPRGTRQPPSTLVLPASGASCEELGVQLLSCHWPAERCRPSSASWRPRQPPLACFSGVRGHRARTSSHPGPRRHPRASQHAG